MDRNMYKKMLSIDKAMVNLVRVVFDHSACTDTKHTQTTSKSTHRTHDRTHAPRTTNTTVV